MICKKGQAIIFNELKNLTRQSTLLRFAYKKFTSTQPNKQKSDQMLGDSENIIRKFNSLYRFQESTSKFKKEKEETEADSKDTSEEAKEQAKPEKSVIQKALGGFKDLWFKTFPKEIDYDSVMNQAMEAAKIIKEKVKYAKPEEIEGLENSVLEWKRGAIVLIEEQVIEDEKKSINQIISSVSSFIKKTEAFGKIKESSTYKEYEQFKDDLKAIKSNIKDNISMSYNPAIVVTKDLMVRRSKLFSG